MLLGTERINCYVLSPYSRDDHLDIAARQQHRENAVQRLMVLEGVCEIDARMLVDVIGVDWSSLKRECDLMKKAALVAKTLL